MKTPIDVYAGRLRQAGVSSSERSARVMQLQRLSRHDQAIVTADVFPSFAAYVDAYNAYNDTRQRLQVISDIEARSSSLADLGGDFDV
jgi:hypothetical protein